MKAVERRLLKVEASSGPPGDVRSMSDRQLQAFLCRSLTAECREGKTFEDVVASYREAEDADVADMLAGCFFWDPETRTVREKNKAECDQWEDEHLRRKRELDDRAKNAKLIVLSRDSW